MLRCNNQIVNRSLTHLNEARRQDFAASGSKITRGATFKKYNIGCISATGGPNMKWRGVK